MSNIETVESLLAAIEKDRLAEIEAFHSPAAIFQPFGGPNVIGSGGIGEWYREFLRDYADCLYNDRTMIEQGDTVALRATLSAKSVDWRPFEQRALEVVELAGGEIAARRVYAMRAGVDFPKAAGDALKKLESYAGGSASRTDKLAREFFGALFSGDQEGAKESLAGAAVLVDGVFGTATGADNVIALFAALPAPAFGRWHIRGSVASASAAAVELAIDPARPRLACWVSVMDEKIVLIESYWMLREIGVWPAVEAQRRFPKQVIYPI